MYFFFKKKGKLKFSLPCCYLSSLKISICETYMDAHLVCRLKKNGPFFLNWIYIIFSVQAADNSNSSINRNFLRSARYRFVRVPLHNPPPPRPGMYLCTSLCHIFQLENSRIHRRSWLVRLIIKANKISESIESGAKSDNKDIWTYLGL